MKKSQLSQNPASQDIEKSLAHVAYEVLLAQLAADKAVQNSPLRLLLAVSGGGDSLALLHLLHSLGKERLWLEVAHVDHQLRVDSAEDAVFVAEQAKLLGLPFHLREVDVAKIAKQRSWNVEEAARVLRYQQLSYVAKKAQGITTIVTAHTQNDQAETVLMQLIRGAAYLKGMPTVQGHVVRPLLGVARASLMSYLASKNITPRTDPTNKDTSRLRSWCRYVLLPQLATRNPNITAQLANLAVTQADTASFVTGLLPVVDWEEGVPLATWETYPAAIQRQLLATALSDLGVEVSSQHIETICQQVVNVQQSGNRKPVRQQMARATFVLIAYQRLHILQSQAKPAPKNQAYNSVAAALVALKKHSQTSSSQGIYDNIAHVENVDIVALEQWLPVSLRNRQAGDRMQLMGGTKKVSDILIDAKVPREKREELLLMVGADGTVLWLESVAIDARVALRTVPYAIEWMKLALEQAHEAQKQGEVPVGAVVVQDTRAVQNRYKVIGIGYNTSESQHDATAHAEVQAIRQAAEYKQDWRLSDCILVVTLEPCLMCLGAAMQAHMPTIIYGASNPREGACGGVVDVLALTQNTSPQNTSPQNTSFSKEAQWKQVPTVQGGVLAAEARALLQTFFTQQRLKSSNS